MDEKGKYEVSLAVVVKLLICDVKAFLCFLAAGKIILDMFCFETPPLHAAGGLHS